MHLVASALLCEASEGGSGPVWGRRRGREGRGGERRVVLWFGVHRAKDGIEENRVSVLLAVARVGARAWCSCLPRVEPLGLLG